MMLHSPLANVSLGYGLLWDRQRELAGARVHVLTDDRARVNATDFLATLHAAGAARIRPVLLAVPSRALLIELMAQPPDAHVWLEVAQTDAADPSLRHHLRRAHERDVRLVWQGEQGQTPEASVSPYFFKRILTLSADQALQALQASRRLQREYLHRPAMQAHSVESPVQPGDLVASVASRALVAPCLDQQSAWGLCDWPVDDVLHGYRDATVQPSRSAIVRTMALLAAEAPLDAIEQTLCADPVLVYRFLRYTQSAELTLPAPIASLRHALMAVGLRHLQRWLTSLLPQASTDLDLQPLRTSLAMRGQVMACMLQGGEDNDLKREMRVCGLLSDVDLLLDQPMEQVLQRFPLATRVTQALLGAPSPYRPYLTVARLLEGMPTAHTLAVCRTLQMPRTELNHAVLRALAFGQQLPGHESARAIELMQHRLAA